MTQPPRFAVPQSRDSHEREADAAAHSLRGGAARPQFSRVPTTSLAPQAALPRSAGMPLTSDVRSELETRLGHDFAAVRVHADAGAAGAADAMGARAYTLGRHVVFGAGEYQPRKAQGRELLAHELAHVVQQQGGAPRVQLQPKKPKAAAPKAAEKPAEAPQPEGLVLNIVVRAPDDAYTNDVVDYMQNTLQQQVIAVDNLEEARAKVQELAKAGNSKVAKVRLVAHGSDTGGIKMTPKGEKGRRFVSAQELEKMAADKQVAQGGASAMAEGATVEFWGCNIARTESSTQSLGKIMGADVKALGGTLATKHDEFVRRADHGEVGDKRGLIATVSSSEIDFRVKEGDKGLGKSFDAWLMKQAAVLEANGDLPPQKDKAVRLAEMKQLFDRSSGKIKTAVVRQGNSGIEQRDKKAWAAQWKTVKVQP